MPDRCITFKGLHLSGFNYNNLKATVMFNILPGKWHLTYSNFPKWKPADISDVTFNYTPEVKSGKDVLKDEVIYHEAGEKKNVTGFDTAANEEQTAFTWRGKGLAMLFTSKWKVEWVSPADNCLIISFEKTLFTPAGIDIICRNKTPDAGLIKVALSEVRRRRLVQGGELFRVV